MKITIWGFLGLLLALLIAAAVSLLLYPFGIVLGLIVLVLYLAFSIKIIFEYERGVLFFLGTYKGVVNPGLVLVLPAVETLIKVSTRIQVADVPPQEIISKDNVPLNINAVAYYKVRDPEQAVLNVENYRNATFQIAQTTLRAIIGQFEMDEILIHRDQINAKLREIIDKDTDSWGIEVPIVEIKDVELPQNLKRAMAKQAEAERERRARIILATGEQEASQKLAEAGKKIMEEPGALQLRLFQAMQEISVEKNSTIIFPYPIELAAIANKFLERMNNHKE
ncbi:MAG: slipin family protein [Methanobacteriota archaeon]|nr:MAG: slipin family protein [Euryarchaeota archaeon]